MSRWLFVQGARVVECGAEVYSGCRSTTLWGSSEDVAGGRVGRVVGCIVGGQQEESKVGMGVFYCLSVYVLRCNV